MAPRRAKHILGLSVMLVSVCLGSTLPPQQHLRLQANDRHKLVVSVVATPDGASLQAMPLGTSGAIADASYIDGAHTPSNMGHLEIVTYGKAATDEQQMRAAGFAEGYLTAEHIHQHYSNMWAFFNISDARVMDFVTRQQAWLRSQLQQPGTQGIAYWDALRAVMHQFDGMVLGYNTRAAETRQAERSHKYIPGRASSITAQLPDMTAAQLYWLCSMADMSDIQGAIQWQHRVQAPKTFFNSNMPINSDAPGWDALTPHEVAVELASSERCSALVKVTPGYENLFVGQVAWYVYSAMLRVFKHYTLDLHNPSLVGHDMGFSSYYGEMSSDDDFYLIAPTGISVLQTTNHIFNATLFDWVQPECVLSWQRVRVANLIARDGDQWAQAVATHNSGTYTNTWAVVANGLFKPGQPLPAGLLTVVEQIPGKVFWEDKTELLESGYFALYNVPVLPQVYQSLGYPEFLNHMASRGPAYEAGASGASRQMAPRAKLFRRDHHTVTDLTAMKRLMRSNNWKEEPYSLNVSTNAICGRGDVDPTSPRAAGCYDGKVSDWAMAMSLEAEVVNGPPSGHSSASSDYIMPAFTWIEPWSRMMPHAGQPAKFDFQWQRVSRQLHKAMNEHQIHVQ